MSAPSILSEPRGNPWSVLQLETIARKEGFSGNKLVTKQTEVVPLSDCTGLLWEFARCLQQEGFVVDTKSYSTCFRVNRKHQTGVAKTTKFDDLLKGAFANPPELATSTNLGCIDYYPIGSGKKNW